MIFKRTSELGLLRHIEYPPFDLADLAFIFAAGGLIGTVYETLLMFALTGEWQCRTGSATLPFNYVYGLGALVIFLVMRRMKNSFRIFVLGMFLGGALEYFLSVFQEYALGISSWDYSDKPLNIGGRTTVKYMFVWGALCFFAVRLIFPALLRLLHRLPARVRQTIAAVIAVAVLLDALITLVAVGRYVGRSVAAVPVSSDLTAFDTLPSGSPSFFDKIFNDDFMRIHFPSMTFKGK